MTDTSFGVLLPVEGFDWLKVNWGGPHDTQTETCSYCRRDLEEDERDYIALRLWSRHGYAAAFCDECMRRWWGMRA